MSKLNFPCLPWKNYNNRVGKFLDPLYYNTMRAEHPGADINGNGGGDSDYGDPIYSIGEGVVKRVGYYPVWGWIIVIDHPEHKVESMYAHCAEVYVKPGQSVSPKQRIATIGKGDKNRYLAHLHFEIRIKKGLKPDAWPSAVYKDRAQAQAFIREFYTDPIKWLEDRGADKV